MSKPNEAFPATPAGRAFAWLWDVLHRGGEGVTQADLDGRFTASFRERREDFRDIDQFRKYARVATLSTAELTEAVAEGDHSLRVTFASRGTRFQVTVEVEAAPPHPIADIQLRLEGGGSLTALDMTAVRAFHHLAHAEWRVLDDEYAITLLGELGEDLKKAASEPQPSEPIPINTPARHRYAEDRLLELVADGLDQYVLLGAGLDTSPLRHRLTLENCRVFELDHPDSQAWKLRRFDSVGLKSPDNVVFIPADLSVDELDVALREGGFDPKRPSFVSWLGVTYYLPVDAVMKTLRTIASWAQGTHVVFDYFLPPDTWFPAMHSQAQVYAALGEPWITWWTDGEVERLLTECGLDTLELVTTDEMIERYAPDAPVELERRAGQHIAHAVVS